MSSSKVTLASSTPSCASWSSNRTVWILNKRAFTGSSQTRSRWLAVATPIKWLYARPILRKPLQKAGPSRRPKQQPCQRQRRVMINEQFVFACSLTKDIATDHSLRVYIGIYHVYIFYMRTTLWWHESFTIYHSHVINKVLSKQSIAYSASPSNDQWTALRV